MLATKRGRAGVGGGESIRHNKVKTYHLVAPLGGARRVLGGARQLERLRLEKVHLGAHGHGRLGAGAHAGGLSGTGGFGHDDNMKKCD